MSRAPLFRSCFLTFGLVLIAVACGQAQGPRKELPKESYERPAQQAHSKSDYAFKLSQMPTFYDVPGEFGHYFEGKDYGFRGLSFILTETYPCGGPPLHKHDTEEAHVLLEGKVSYLIGDKRFAVEGPYIARVPAGVAHTFMNAGDKEFRLVAVFPDDKLTYQKVGENPLVGTCVHE